jgi:Amt family ammonium transporter
VFSFAAWYAIGAILGGIRVAKEEEIEGLDIGEHGMESYTGFPKESLDVVEGASYADVLE